MLVNCKHCGKEIVRYKCNILPNGNFCSHSCRMKAQVHSPERKERMSKLMSGSGNPMYGVPCSNQRRARIKESNKGINKGSKNGMWKNGSTTMNKLVRQMWEYNHWRHSVFVRDDFKCQECGGHCNDLHAHHLKSLSSILDEYNIREQESARGCKELWDIGNGYTMCKSCHYILHRALNYQLRAGNCPKDHKHKGMPKAG